MMFPRLIAAAIGLLLPLSIAATADAKPAVAHQDTTARVVTVAEQPATVQMVARHRHHRYHHRYTRHGNRRHG